MPETTAQNVDAVAFLSNDHRALEELFKRIETGSDPVALKQYDRGTVVQRIVDELSAHAEIEEEILYPAIRQEVPDGDQLADHAEAEHQEVKDMLERLQGMDPESSEAQDLLQELHQSLQEHFEEEEGADGLFARLRASVDHDRLQEMGTQLAEAKTSRSGIDPSASGGGDEPPPRQDIGGSMFGP